jgi:hypothetical protein
MFLSLTDHLMDGQSLFYTYLKDVLGIKNRRSRKAFQ